MEEALDLSSDRMMNNNNLTNGTIFGGKGVGEVIEYKTRVSIFATTYA